MLETFAPFFAVALVALLVGLMLGKTWSRRLVCVSLALWGIGFAAYAIGMNYSRTADDLHWLRGAARTISMVSLSGLYCASGLLGPALAKPSASTAMISAAATLVVLVPGTFVMFALACGLAGDCI
jgi:hypothetical protein